MKKQRRGLFWLGDSGFTEEEKMMTMKNIRMTRKSRMSGFSRGKLEAGENELDLCSARYESKSCCYCVLKV